MIGELQRHGAQLCQDRIEMVLGTPTGFLSTDSAYTLPHPSENKLHQSLGYRLAKLLSPERRRSAVSHACERGASERHACLLLGQPRGTQRYRPTQREDEAPLTQAIVTLASQYGRYGYRRITALPVRSGWQVGKDRVERIWRREGLKVPKRHKPRGRLWLNDGSCVRVEADALEPCVELRTS
jgi:hypothetical protein